MRAGWYEVRHQHGGKVSRWWFDAEEDRWRSHRWATRIYHPGTSTLSALRWRGLVKA